MKVTKKDTVNNLRESVMETYKDTSKEALKEVIAQMEAKRKENVAANTASIALYRARAAETKELSAKVSILRDMLKTEDTVKKAEAVMEMLSESQIKELLAKLQK